MARTTTSTDKGNVVFVANHHTAPILLPRTAAIGVNVDPIVLEAGMVTPVNADEWESKKKIPTVQYYLDHKILEETNAQAPAQTSVTDATTSDAPIPANLQTVEEQSKTSAAPGAAPVSASVRRSSVTQQEVQ